ncbi:MAG: hypothetical protein ACRC50_03285 [Gaiella sp.]
MRLARAAALVVALVALAAAGAAAAMLLLSTIGGAPADDPVGRLRPVVSGLDVGATSPATTAPVSADDDGDATDDGRGEATRPDDVDDD